VVGDALDRELAPDKRPCRELVETPVELRGGSVAHDVDDHEAFVFVGFGDRRSFDRTSVENRRGDRLAAKISREHLVTMNMARQHRRESNRDVAATDDVGRGREREIVRPDGRAFDALVNAKQLCVSVELPPPRGFDEIDELRAKVVTLRGKPGYAQTNAANVEPKCARAIEQVNSRVSCKPDLRDASTLVISRDDENRNAFVGDTNEWLERLPRDARRRTRPVEHVAAVNDQINVAVERGLQRGGIVCEKIVSATPTMDARPRRQIEAEVGVSEEEDADAFGHGEKIDVGSGGVASRGVSRRILRLTAEDDNG
jgi:hypothetical protein